jgi:hypothetical protein
MLTTQFEILKKVRQSLLNLISDLSAEQLNKVPEGFNNNIIWNLAHLIASQQGICYRRGELPFVVKEDLFHAYKPGTKPEGDVSEQFINEIKNILLSTVDRMQTDFEKGLFQNNPPWTTRSGIDLLTIEDSINFILYHDGLHTGYIMALKRLVG